MKVLFYSDISQFNNGYIAIKSKGKWGYVDKTGKRIIPSKYTDTRCFSENLAAVQKNGKYGFIDQSDREVIPFIYDFAGDFSEGLAAVGVNGKFGFINNAGEMVIPYQYDDVFIFSLELAAVCKNKKYGYIDAQNNVIIPFMYDHADTFVHNLARVRIGDKVGYINKENKAVIPIQHQGDYCFNANSGVVAILKSGSDNTWSLYDNEGKLIKTFTGYTYIGEFNEDTAPITNEAGEWGIINSSGEFVIPCKYEKTMSFYLGIACAIKDGKIGFVNKSDKKVIPFDYDAVSIIGEGFVLASSGKINSYIIDQNGDIKIILVKEKSILLLIVGIIALVIAFLIKMSS